MNKRKFNMSELSTTEVRQIVEEVCQHLVDTTGNYQRAMMISYDDQVIERERIFKKIRDLYKADERQLLEDLHDTASNYHSCQPVWTFRTSIWTSEMGPISKWYESGPYWAPRIVLDSADHVSKLNLTNYSFTFKGQIPSCLTRFSELTTLYLRDNELTGEICSGLSRLNKLEELDLTDNKFTGDIPPSLGELTNLVSLLLGSNELTGSIPSSFSALKNLNVFDLSHNFLSGEIDMLLLPWLAQGYQSTWNMDDAGSGFSFSIIGDLELHCDILNLNSWNLTGAIPESIGKLTNLTVLDFSNNQLEGAIPESIGQLTNLTELVLENNQLKGAIPESIGQLTNLTVLDLSNNQLEGGFEFILPLTMLHSIPFKGFWEAFDALPEDVAKGNLQEQFAYLRRKFEEAEDPLM